MNGVATIPLQRTMSGAIQRSQSQLAVTQAQLSTGKKAADLAALGTETVRNLSARTLVAKQEAHAAVSTRIGTTLALYDANITGLDTLGSDLRLGLLNAVGTGKAVGLQDSVDAAFQQFRAIMNASEAGTPLFGGSQTTPPFTPEKLGDIVGLDPAAAFTNDDVRASARVGDNLDVEYGVTASTLGKDMLAAFKTLAEAGPIGDTPTDAQMTALKTVMVEIDTALGTVRAVNSDNGRRQAQVETLSTRAEERALLLKDIISRNEDADLGQVAMNLAQQKTTLQASYSVFSQLSELSLASYLR
jgi:flagellar hook-associated protein 3 FlgL